MKQCIPVIIILFLASCTTRDPDSERFKIAQDAFSEKVREESKDNIFVNVFSKKNGIEKSPTSYTLEWEATVQTKREGWKHGDIMTGYWKNFNYLTEEPSNSWGTSPKRYEAHTQINLKGECHMELTDNGWRVNRFKIK